MAMGRLAAHHGRQLVGLALEGERLALDLLVVLELQLEQPDHLHGRPGGAGDGDAGVAIGRVHLLHVAMADEVAGGGPAIAGHDHAVDVADGDHGGAVGDLEVVVAAAGHGPAAAARPRPRSARKLGPGSSSALNMGSIGRQAIGSRQRADRGPRPSRTPAAGGRTKRAAPAPGGGRPTAAPRARHEAATRRPSGCSS